MEDMHKTIVEWIGEGIINTPHDLKDLIWAMATNEDLFDDFKKAVTDRRKKMDRERRGS